MAFMFYLRFLDRALIGSICRCHILQKVEPMTYSRRKVLKQSVLSSALIAMGQACSKDRIDKENHLSKAFNLDTDYAKVDAVSLARHIREKNITPTELVDIAIERAEKVNPKLNAIVTKTFDAARQAAKNTDDRVFSGVPTFIKDLANVTGVTTRAGSRSTAGYIPDKQYPFIDDFNATGLISLGKTATPEFGLTATTETEAFGPTRNPWNLDHSTGGSSGGAAALVAAGVVPMAHASDGGGSVRIPASCCGLVGLKVSNDRFRPVRDESRTPVRISVQGVVSRTVRDTAAFMAAMEINNGKTQTGLVTRSSKKRLKIALITDAFDGVEVDKDVANTVKNAAELCQSLGHTITPFKGNIDPILGDHFLIYWAGIATSLITDWENTTGQSATEQNFEAFTLGLREHFLTNQEQATKSLLYLIGFAKTWREQFADCDIIMSPVLTKPPVPIGYIGPDVPYDQAIKRLYDYVRYTTPANIAGTPSLSLPLGMSAKSLPIGVLLNGAPWAEQTLLELAYELEAAAPWINRAPPFSALK